VLHNYVKSRERTSESRGHTVLDHFTIDTYSYPYPSGVLVPFLMITLISQIPDPFEPGNFAPHPTLRQPPKRISPHNWQPGLFSLRVLQRLECVPRWRWTSVNLHAAATHSTFIVFNWPLSLLLPATFLLHRSCVISRPGQWRAPA